MKTYAVHQTIELPADAMTVWNALTNPELTKRYFFGCRVLSDWQPGSSITFKGRMFWIIPIRMKGTIIKAIPGKLLQYTLKNGKGKDATESTVTDKLTFKNGKTTLSITDDVGAGEGAEKRYRRSVKGWRKILTGLKNLLSK